MFKRHDDSTALGRVVEVSGSKISLDVLTEVEEGTWLVSSEPQEMVGLDMIQRTIPFEYGQRVIPDRISNPHGEHSEEVFGIEEALLPQGVHRGDGQVHH